MQVSQAQTPPRPTSCPSNIIREAYNTVLAPPPPPGVPRGIITAVIPRGQPRSSRTQAQSSQQSQSQSYELQSQSQSYESQSQSGMQSGVSPLNLSGMSSLCTLNLSAFKDTSLPDEALEEPSRSGSSTPQ